jgi:hypothetical protein
MRRELTTIAIMVGMYCYGRHERKSLCPDCRQLLDYAQKRLGTCPFQEGKTTCLICPVHCYRADMRLKVRAVMRYAGPRMVFRHPALAVHHIFDSRRKKPVAFHT